MLSEKSFTSDGKVDQLSCFLILSEKVFRCIDSQFRAFELPVDTCPLFVSFGDEIGCMSIYGNSERGVKVYGLLCGTLNTENSGR